MYIDDDGLYKKSFTYRGWKIRIDPPRQCPQWHIHVDGYGKHFAQNKDGTPHDGLTGIPDRVIRDLISKHTNGEWKWKINKKSYERLHYWHEGFSIETFSSYQEGFSIEKLPPYQEGFSVTIPTINQEGYSINRTPNWQEGFSIDTNTTSTWVIVGTIVIAIVYIGGAILTGGVSLVIA